jgi:hypothetical protein
MDDEPGICLNSSIPFVLVGADRDSDNTRMERVLARGSDAGIELVGFVRESEVTQEYVESGRFLPTLLGRKRFWAVRSRTIAPIHSAMDKRHSTYVLAWKGTAPISSWVKEEFDRSLPDVLIGIEHRSPSETEWALGRVIFLVEQMEARLLRRRHLLWFSTALYVVAIAAILSIVFFA